MSRVIVKNLPKTITEEKLRRHFDGPFEVTDLRLKKDPATGRFRGFAFIGFRDEIAGEAIVKQHDNTFLDRNRISIEVYNKDALPFKEKLKQKEEERRKRKEEYEARKMMKRPKLVNPIEQLKDDAEFQEFLNVQRNIGSTAEAILSRDKDTDDKKYVWKDDILGSLDTKADQANDESTEEQSEEEEDSKRTSLEGKLSNQPKRTKPSLDYTIKLSNLPYKVGKTAIRSFFHPLQVLKLVTPLRIKGIAYVSFKSKEDMDKSLRKHKSLLNGKQIHIQIKKESTSSDTSSTPTTIPKMKEEHPARKETVADTGRLFVRNLPYTCSPEDLESLFKSFGPLTEVYLPIDMKTKRVKGFAFITFVFPEHAAQAMDQLDKTVFQGRLINILPGDHLRVRENQLSSFKEKKEEQIKETRKKASTWNTLFLGANAAADVMSSQFNVKKSDLVADTNTKDSIAVRIALGETQIVDQTKKFLEDNGINLSAFEEEDVDDKKKRRKQMRSKTVILVKNLAVGIEASVISNLFSRFGSVNKVILPRHGVTGIVEMQEEVEAKKAFNALINYKLNHIPIYLEWAPVDVFGGKKSQENNQKDDQESVAEVEKEEEVQTNKNLEEDNSSQADRSTEDIGQAKNDDTGSEEGFCLFVKNLNFKTTDESLYNHFISIGKIVSAKISRKKGSNLSNGYGFVVYKTKKSAEKALRQLQDSSLDGHRLQVQKSVSRSLGVSSPVKERVVKSASTESNTNRDTKKPVDNVNKTSKILVRNVPFEASVKEVSQLFSSFGGLKSVRMPKKMVASAGSSIERHRGFAFVDFVSRSQAEKAFKMLSGSTHLYGRRLVLEWAKQEDSSVNFYGDDDEEDDKDRQKTSLSSGSKRLKKSDLVTRLQLTQTKDSLR